METELREWLDRLAIQDLIYRYSDAVTRADWVQCASVFAPDAVWEAPTLGLRYESAGSFIDAIKTTGFEVLIQTAHSPVVTLMGIDRAKATTTIHEMNRCVTAVSSELAAAGEVLNVDMYGIYYDDISRIDGEWKFVRRVFVSVYTAPGAITGDVATTRSDLARPD